ncbi:hypothetical protein ATCC90586_003376 [Pythium insidiosum]|nr:hypothetical protein ATCC90586_003376 [Pythium insidiosum]
MLAVVRELLLPLTVLINHTVLLYLLSVYWPRRREPRVLLLFVVAVLNTMSLVPFARPDDELVTSLNDVSELCCVLTFLVQITIIGHDVGHRLKLRTVQRLTRAAEGLIALDVVAISVSLSEVFQHDSLPAWLAIGFPGVCENVTLIFIVVFRFSYLALASGWRHVWWTRKTEVVCYLLFATHEVPFLLIGLTLHGDEDARLNWEFAQALHNRVTILLCLWVTLQSKLQAADRRRSAGSVTRHQASASQRSWRFSMPRRASLAGPRPVSSTIAQVYVTSQPT